MKYHVILLKSTSAELESFETKEEALHYINKLYNHGNIPYILRDFTLIEGTILKLKPVETVKEVGLE